MNEEFLTGALGWKGERGYSAYEIAVQNGYEGTEQDWLATLGTSSHFSEDKTIYTTSTSSTTSVSLPNSYTSSSIVEVYVNGQRLNSNEYEVDTTNRLIIFTNTITVSGTIIEVVITTMSTNNLPIVNTINSSSTNDTAPGTKATYDFVKGEEENYYSKTEIDTTLGNYYTKTQTDAKYFEKGNIVKISLSDVKLNPTGLGSIVVNYPTGCNRSNMNLISFKIKKHGGGTYDYTMFGTRRYLGETSSIGEPSLTITYQDNAMYVSGTAWWFSDVQQDIDLIFMKI